VNRVSVASAVTGVVDRGARVVSLPVRPFLAVNAVDDWGRDQRLIDAALPLTGLRWQVNVGGVDHLPARGGALLVTNNRRWSLSAVYASLALSDASERPVRFAGRPDVAPLGAMMRRLGGILDRPDEVEGALAAGEVVLVTAAATGNPRHAGDTPSALIAAAVRVGVPIHPVASMSAPLSRAARVEVGPRVHLRHSRRGPLADVELACATTKAVQRMLDGLGGVRTGVGLFDFWSEG
jgi:hypothetical protein